MRFDTPVFFRHVTPGEYDPTTGDYLPDTVQEVRRMASVTDSGIATVKLLYGDLKEGSKVIRLQRAYKEPFAHIRIGAKVYAVDMARGLLTKHTFIVHEVQGNG